MNTPQDRFKSRLRWFARVLGAASLGVMTVVIAQSTPPLTITSPANGTAVMPGQALAVVVTAVGTYPNGVAIIGQDPLGAAGPSNGLPSTLYLTIPPITSPGIYSITAVAANASGVLITSAPVTVAVERTDTATAIFVEPISASLRFIGDSLPIGVAGTFTGGQLVDITRSSKLTMKSENPSVVTIENGLIIAAGPGRTNIDVLYGLTPARIAVTVPTSARGDLNGDGKIDESDLNIILSALSTPANGPNDARDLNRDGQINIKDARILVTLCAQPRCGITKIPDDSILEELFDH